MVYVLYDKLGNWLIKLQDSIHFGIEFSDSEEWGENFCSSLADGSFSTYQNLDDFLQEFQ